MFPELTYEQAKRKPIIGSEQYAKDIALEIKVRAALAPIARVVACAYGTGKRDEELNIATLRGDGWTLN